MRPDVQTTGRARRFGDDINTDYIITSKRKRETIDERELKQWLFETLDAGFAASVRDGDVIVAGRNFGCGSAMEVAATVILAAGIRTVIAQSFSRTFFRNAINNGLLPIECDTTTIAECDAVEVVVDSSRIAINVPARGLTLTATPLSPIAQEILHSGGLVEFVKRRGTREKR